MSRLILSRISRAQKLSFTERCHAWARRELNKNLIISTILLVFSAFYSEKNLIKSLSCLKQGGLYALRSSSRLDSLCWKLWSEIEGWVKKQISRALHHHLASTREIIDISKQKWKPKMEFFLESENFSHLSLEREQVEGETSEQSFLFKHRTVRGEGNEGLPWAVQREKRNCVFPVKLPNSIFQFRSEKFLLCESLLGGKRESVSRSELKIPIERKPILPSSPSPDCYQWAPSREH